MKPILAIFLMLGTALLLAQETKLSLSLSGPANGAPNPTDGIYEILPGSRIIVVPASAPAKGTMVLEFEFFCVGGASPVRFAPTDESKAYDLPPLDHSEAWSPYRARLDHEIDADGFILSFGLAKDRVLQLRKPRLRPERPGEFDETKSDLRSVPEEIILAELDRDYPAALTEVTLGKDEVTIKGRITSGIGSVELAEIPIDKLLTDKDRFLSFHPVATSADGSFTLSLPRIGERSGRPFDRFACRWRLVSRDGIQVKTVSRARYAEDVASIRDYPPAAAARHKKGISGYRSGKIDDELKTLGISAITLNILMDSVLGKGPGTGRIPYTWQGKTYHANEGQLRRLDNSLLEAAEHNAVVSAILLVRNPTRGGKSGESLLAHPDAEAAGTFAMPDVSSEDGANAYAGLINFMAKRWTRADGKYGRIHDWIVQNEVDAGWVWTNVGEIPAAPFMDLYQRSLRITDLIVRQYDPNARALISLTHHWTHAGNPRFYGSKKMFELLQRFTEAEGDFPWAVAFHPYPENLRKPRTWEDGMATPSFDTLKITPRNIEVLDAWMHRDEMRYRGKVRGVQLSENGFNSPKNSPQSLKEQAAAMAYVWKKIQPLTSIEVWHYHNWFDNPNEGGLLLGMRTFESEGGKPKPIWRLYRDLHTPREDAACAPYLKTIGLKSWDEALLHFPAD